ncbi:MAG: TerB family tellurite resistance protein [Muribaculaceae bacterium]|nr:TerB family tellurite resistance protein [Muribaculaceae bacterium]
MEQNYQAIERVVRLAAKTGLYFASVDGDYSNAERIFIENYKNQLAQVGPISDVQGIFNQIFNKPVSLSEVINETHDLLDLMPTPADKQAVVVSLGYYIQRIIMADGMEHPAEREAYNTWVKSFV